MLVLFTSCFFWVCFIAAGYYSGGNSFGPELAWYTVASRKKPRAALPGAALLVGVWLYSGLASRQYAGWSSLTEAAPVTARRLAVLAEQLGIPAAVAASMTT
jgi:hypothetical protein